MASKSRRRSILKSRNSIGSTDTEEVQPQVQQCVSIVNNTITSIRAKRVSFSSKAEIKEIPNLCAKKQEEFPDMEMTFCAGGDEDFEVFEINNENVPLSVMDMSMTMIGIDCSKTDIFLPNVSLSAYKNQLHQGLLYEGIQNEPISSCWMGNENMEMTSVGDASCNFSAFKTYNGNLPYSTLDMSMTVLHMESMSTEAKSISPTVENHNEAYQVSSSEQNPYEPVYFTETENMEMTFCGEGEDSFLAFQTYNGNVDLSTQDMSMTVLHEALRKTELKCESPNKVHQTENETAVNQNSVNEQTKDELTATTSCRQTENMEMTCLGGADNLSAFKTYNENLPQTVSDMSLTMQDNMEEQNSFIPQDKEPSRSHTSPNQGFNKNPQPVLFADSKKQLSTIPIWSTKMFPGKITKGHPKIMLDRVVYSDAARFRRNNVDTLRKQFQGSYGKFASVTTPKRKIAGLKHEVEVQTTPSLANQCAGTSSSVSMNIQLIDPLDISITAQMTVGLKIAPEEVKNVAEDVPLTDKSEISILDQMTVGSKMASKDIANISKNIQSADRSEISLSAQMMVGLKMAPEEVKNVAENVPLTDKSEIPILEPISVSNMDPEVNNAAENIELTDQSETPDPEPMSVELKLVPKELKNVTENVQLTDESEMPNPEPISALKMAPEVNNAAVNVQSTDKSEMSNPEPISAVKMVPDLNNAAENIELIDKSETPDPEPMSIELNLAPKEVENVTENVQLTDELEVPNPEPILTLKMAPEEVNNAAENIELTDKSETPDPEPMPELKMAPREVRNAAENVQLNDKSEMANPDPMSPELKIVSKDFENIETDASIEGICTGSEPSFGGITQDELARTAGDSPGIFDVSRGNLISSDVENDSDEEGTQSVSTTNTKSYSTNTVLMSLLQSFESAVGLNSVALMFKIQSELCNLPDDQFEEFCRVESESDVLPKTVLESCQLTRHLHTQYGKKLYVLLEEKRNGDI